MRHLYLLLFLVLIIGCKRNKEIGVNQPYKVYAINPNLGNPKDVCLHKKQVFCEHRFLFKEGQQFYEVPGDNMLKSRDILMKFINSCRKTKENGIITPMPIEYYFRQYIGYREGNVDYIYINLCAFYNEQFKQPGLFISDNYLHSVLSTKDIGYAGHVIIDMDKLTVKEFHFEEFPEIEE